jgi:predicted DNA-binding protein with PD1-like motif
MKIVRDGDVCLMRLERGEKLRERLEGFAAASGIGTGVVIHGIGAVAEVGLRYYDLDARTYLTIPVPAGGHELVSTQANLAWKDGKPFLHMHVAIGGRRGETLSGHLEDAVVHVTVELVILTFPDLRVGRTPDEAVGLALWDFPGSCEAP